MYISNGYGYNAGVTFVYLMRVERRRRGSWEWGWGGFFLYPARRVAGAAGATRGSGAKDGNDVRR